MSTADEARVEEFDQLFGPDAGPIGYRALFDKGWDTHAEWVSSQLNNDRTTALIESVDNFNPELVRKYPEAAFKYLEALVEALESVRGVLQS